MASGKKKNKANMRVLIAATGIVILLKLDSNDRFFSLQPWNLMMTSKNNMASLLYYVKLLESFRSHRRTQTCITVLKHLGSKLAFFCPVWPWNLKKKWPRKTLGHCFYATSRFLHHFIGIEFKLELHSGNVQFWSKYIFLSCVTLKFDRWHWKTIGHLFNATSNGLWMLMLLWIYVTMNSRKLCSMIMKVSGEFFFL